MTQAALPEPAPLLCRQDASDRLEGPSSPTRRHLADNGLRPMSPALGRRRNATPTTIEMDGRPWHVVRPLGRGGFGSVYEVRADDGTRRAIKRIKLRHDVPLSAQELANCQRGSVLFHPSLLKIEQVAVEPHRVTMLMELADGTLLDVFEKSGETGLARSFILDRLTEAAEALDYLNQIHNLVHLDVKPGNLFLVDGFARVGDFGLMRHLHEDQDRHDLNGLSPSYAGPELFNGKPTVTSDQYALAVVFMELLTGQRPFSSTSPRQIMFEQLTKGPNLSALSEADREIITRALDPDPAWRYPTCQTLMNLLRQVEGENATTNMGRAMAGQSSGPAPRRGRRLRASLSDRAKVSSVDRSTPRNVGKTKPDPKTPAGRDSSQYRRVTSVARLPRTRNVPRPDAAYPRPRQKPPLNRA